MEHKVSLDLIVKLCRRDNDNLCGRLNRCDMIMIYGLIYGNATAMLRF